MPEYADILRRKHPAVKNPSPAAPEQSASSLTHYVELRCKSNFSFLRGASHPEELAERAAELRYAAIGIADIATLAGVVRMHCAAKSANLHLLVGAEIQPDDGDPITLYAMNRAGYGRLSRLITTGRRRAPKNKCYLSVADVLEHAEDLIAIVHATTDRAACYRTSFGDRLYLGIQAHCGPDDKRCLAQLHQLARTLHLQPVAVNDVHYHLPERRYLQDALVCIREHCTITDAGGRLFPNAERHLKSPEQMAALFADYPESIHNTRLIAERCTFNLEELRYEYPPELCPPGKTPAQHLGELAWAGANTRYSHNIPDKIRRLIEHELELIAELSYEHYFLTVWDLVRFARSQGILCQGRGSAANSAVCYCLGITSVDPGRIDLLFERFVSAERNEPPDIDVDFEHERREEVIQYIYEKYGRERAGIAAEVITYRPRSAVRDLGKALGLSLDKVDAIAKKVEWWSDVEQIDDRLREAGLDPKNRTVRLLVKLCRQVMGFPRHLSQHVGGFVMTAGPLCEMVPIENAAMPDRTFIEWDKDDIDALGILKVDCLALGMLTAIRKCFDLIVDSTSKTQPASFATQLFAEKDANERLASVPPEDPAVYDMACKADTVGVFQIESRAQMSMLPRLKPRCFYDLVIEVAIVRPGPIQGGMVHPYLRRRCGQESVGYPSAEVEDVLRKTLGVPLFQEQAMRLAVVAAGFTPGEADQLRRSMAAWRRSGSIDKFHGKLITGMRAKGYSVEYAERLFNQLRGFGEYGFPESHAASFALLVYVSCWMKRYYPAAFAAAVINSQPMGFYAPAQLVRDAREHGVRVLAVDVNHSDYDCRLECEGLPQLDRDCPPEQWGETGPTLRLGMRLIKGISQSAVEGIVRARKQRRYTNIHDLVRRSEVSKATLARLAAADAFGSMGLNRRQALWRVLGIEDELPLFAGIDTEEPSAALPEMTLKDRIVEDYLSVGMSLRAHPMSLLREDLNQAGISTAKQMRESKQGTWLEVAGIVLVRQRPSTALGTVFMTLEDETGTANLVVRPKVYEQFRPIARGATAMIASGRIERQSDVIHLQVTKMQCATEMMTRLKTTSRNFH